MLSFPEVQEAVAGKNLNGKIDNICWGILRLIADHEFRGTEASDIFVECCTCRIIIYRVAICGVAPFRCRRSDNHLFFGGDKIF